MTAENFQIQIQKEVLFDLSRRLKNTRWADELIDSGWDYGTNLEYLKTLVAYWQSTYDWTTHEARLNRLAQFKATIDGVAIHFIHERGKGPSPLPIVLTHGWPDSFLRFEKIIPMLTDPASFGGDPADSFDVVVPSLPGFGFSDKLSENGNIFHIHDLWANLMTKVLGYERFAAHGGDLGGIVTEHLARSHSQHVVGIHMTDIPFIHIFQKPDDLSEAEEKYLAAINEWQMREGAYNMIQSTRPQTLGAGLNDSPAGLAAWLVEKFQSQNDCDGDIDRCFTKDELLTNVMLYWMTESINSSFRSYYELMNAGAMTWIGEKVKEWTGSSKVPAAFAMSPKDNTHPPREWAERFFNVKRWTTMKRGAHFTAWEQPELFAEDIREFFRDLR